MEIFVINGVLNDIVLKLINRGIELIVVGYLNDLFVGEELIFCVLVDGKLIVGLEFEIVCGVICYCNV